MAQKRTKIRLINRRNQIILRTILSLISLSVIIIIFFMLINKNHIVFNATNEQCFHAEYNEPYEHPDILAQMHGNILFKDGISTDISYKSNVDVTKLGTYQVECIANGFLCSKKIVVTVNVEDTTPPEITLTTNTDNYTIPGQPYVEEGYKAIDNFDGDVTSKVVATESNGTVTYTVSDSHGNVGSAVRKIIYNDPIPPEITLLGQNTMTIGLNQTYNEPGYTASDNCDGDITSSVTVSGNVDTSTAGDYVLTYTATDSYKNSTSVTRTVTVSSKVAQQVTVNPGSKVVYLTFDDGPSRYTGQLLDVLDKYNVKATFFTVNTGYSYMMAKEAAAGHSVAIHSLTHDYGQIYSSTDAFFSDIQAQAAIITEQTGISPTMLRFPGGSSNTVSRRYCSGIMSALANAVEAKGYQYYDWNVLSGDAGETTDTSTIIQNIISGISSHDVSIVLQHDIYQYSVNAVEDVIVWGLNNGYTFLPLTPNSPKAHQHINN